MVGMNNMSWASIVSAALLIVCLTAKTQGAEISVTAASSETDNLNLIMLTGEIVLGDAERFNKAVADVPGDGTVVMLDSPGGRLFDGLSIGSTVRMRGYYTAVGDGRTCASTCALIWLAGHSRYMGQTARIGFHAAYIENGGDVHVSGAGNALVGSYLAKLGLSDEAVYFMTEPAPDEALHWLDPEIAKRLGLRVTELSDPRPPLPSIPPLTGDPAVPTPIASPAGVSEPVHSAPAARVSDLNSDLATGSVLERQVMHLIVGYYALWSKGGTDIAALAKYYAPTVNFFGDDTPRQRITEIKQSFAQRWPDCQFTISKIVADCRVANTCMVTGSLTWDAKSKPRNDHSAGSATFSYAVGINNTVSPPLATITAEAGATLQGNKAPLHDSPPASGAQQPETSAISTSDQSAAAAAATLSFADGRRDRIAYETWYAGLSNGAYHDGAEFWAAHRSDGPAPPCVPPGMPQNWQQGCLDSRTRLVTSDFRRKSDRNYWSGWNSL